MIGIFYYWKDTLYMEATKTEDAEIYGDFRTTSNSHMSFWERKLKKGLEYDFDYYPRGRVVYNMKADTYTVFIDKDLDSLGILNKIANSFELQEKRYAVRYDEHYQCHMCNEDYVI